MVLSKTKKLIIVLVFFCFNLILSGQPLDRKAFSEVYKKAKGSVVMIRISTTVTAAGRLETIQGGGSGVIISSDGLIVTNKHVVDDTTRSFKIILSNGEERGASFVGMAPDTDLSLIRLDKPDGLIPLVLGDSDKAEEGDWVLVIGSPFGLGGTLTVGVISAKERTIPIPDQGGRIQPHTLIQTDASINPGNSGGALVNLAGELIGIPTMNLSSSGASVGVGFAIPANVVKRIVKDITSKKDSVGWLGILVQDIAELAPAIRKQLGISQAAGLVVTGIESGSPAQGSDIKQYDVIISVDGQKVSDVTGFKWQERNLTPGETVVVQVHRRGNANIQEIQIVAGQLKN